MVAFVKETYAQLLEKALIPMADSHIQQWVLDLACARKKLSVTNARPVALVFEWQEEKLYFRPMYWLRRDGLWRLDVAIAFELSSDERADIHMDLFCVLRQAKHAGQRVAIRL